jgi:acetolactate synthase-1/2/3 large subunit
MRRGPVHIAIPSDVARGEQRDGPSATSRARRHSRDGGSLGEVVAAIQAARRPVAILGLDLDPRAHAAPVRAFVEALGIPVFVTPKAKGMFPEDHPQFHAVCAGVSGDGTIVDFLAGSDLLVGIGFDPVESDKLWHHTMPLVSIGPESIAAGSFRPRAEVTGDLDRLLQAVLDRLDHAFEWQPSDATTFRARLQSVLRPAARPRGLSGYELTLRLRERFPRDTIFTTDVGSVKMITSQAWAAYEPLTLFESTGLSAMSYAIPAAMAVRLHHPDRPVLCTIGDGGFGMTLAEIETCVRERIHFITVVFNDNSLSLIDAAQQRRGLPVLGVRYGAVDFAAAAVAMGAWGRRVETMGELDTALDEAFRVHAPVVIDAVVDPAEYAAQTAVPRRLPA